MRLDKQKILKTFALFTDIDDIELHDWSFLCENAEAQIVNRLRENVSMPRNMERLCTAAAAVAYHDYTILSLGFSGDIRVGDISLGATDKRSAAHDAIGIRDHFLTQIADLITSTEGFAVLAAECVI